MDEQYWYVIYDNITSQYLIRRPTPAISEQWSHDIDDFEDHRGFALFSTRSLAQKVLQEVEQEFINNGDEIDFSILHVKAVTTYRLEQV